MPKSLSRDQIARYRAEGYLAPLRVMSAAEAGALRARLEAVEARLGGPLRGDLRHKSHLLVPFLADLVRYPAILDAVEDLIGPDILCWNSNFFKCSSAAACSSARPFGSAYARSLSRAARSRMI